MNRLSLLASAILAQALSFGASAAVICEFEPSADYRDCQKCFKADMNGVQLFVDGKLRASSTSQVLFPSTPIDGQVYQRGVEKVLLSQRHGRKKLYEVCYERATPMQASDFQLAIKGDELEEFEMGRPGALRSDEHQFAVASAPAGVRVAFFGSKLVVQPLPGWNGVGDLTYEIIGADGIRSKPGRITLKARAAIAEVQGDNEADAAELALAVAAEQQLAELQGQLMAAQEALSLENEARDELRVAVASLEAQLIAAQARLEEVEFQIATAVHAKARAREQHAQHLQALEIAAEGIRRSFLEVAIMNQLAALAPVAEGPARSPKRAPVQSGSVVAILPRRMSVSRVEEGEAVSDAGPLPKPIALIARPVRSPAPRRLSKKAKKQLRKQRQRDTAAIKPSRRRKAAPKGLSDGSLAVAS
ncbi:hypothetical protein ACRCPS_17940 [Pseudomonas aeruginosa]